MTYYITGGFGFIGINLINYLYYEEKVKPSEIVVVERFDVEHRKKVMELTESSNLFSHELNTTESLNTQLKPSDIVIHLGAISNTLENNAEKIYKNNTLYTLEIGKMTKKAHCKLIFISSASVYGNMTDGQINPLNNYAYSKYAAECLLKQYKIPVVVLRLFNVYGLWERLKRNKMASVLTQNYYNTFYNKRVALFKDEENSIKRDFVFVKDVCQIIYFFTTKFKPGIYDVGMGISSSFETMLSYAFHFFNFKPKIKHIKIPEHIINQYQFQTIADLYMLRKAGYGKKMTTLSEGVEITYDSYY